MDAMAENVRTHSVWWAMADPGQLGCPTSNKGPCPTGSPQGCVALQQFEGGFIWSDGSIHIVTADLYSVSDNPSAADYYRSLVPGISWLVKDGTAPNIARNLKYFGEGLLFHGVDATGGQFRRSADAGETWTDLPTPSTILKPIDVDRSPDARIWSLWQNSSFGRVFYSEDNGDTWLLSKEIPSSFAAFGSIAANPTDSNRIAIAWVVNTGLLRVSVTVDKGVNWTTYNPFGFLGGGILPQIVWNGARLVVVADNGTALRLLLSTDDGASWTQQTLTTTSVSTRTQVIRAGTEGVMFVRAGSTDTSPPHVIARSTDRGSTWTNVGALPSGSLIDPMAIAYDEGADTLYVTWLCCLSPGRRVTRLRSASTRDWTAVTPSEWEDLPYLSDSPGRSGLIVMFDR